MKGGGCAQGFNQGENLLNVAAGGGSQRVTGDGILECLNNVSAGDGKQYALQVVVAGRGVAGGIIPGDFHHMGGTVADPRLGAGERVALLIQISFDTLHREELVEVAADQGRVGAGEDLGGQLGDVGVLEEEVLEIGRVVVAVFASQRQQNGDVAVALLGRSGILVVVVSDSGGFGLDVGVSGIVDVHGYSCLSCALIMS